MTSESAIQLEQRIKREIPLCDAMQLRIDSLSEHSIKVSAPISANRNLHGSAFAGSLYTLGAISGWALMTHYGELHYPNCSVVVRNAEVDYQLPVTTSNIAASTQLPEAVTLEQFHQYCQERGKASLTLNICIQQQGQAAVNLKAKYTLLTEQLASQIKGDH